MRCRPAFMACFVLVAFGPFGCSKSGNASTGTGTEATASTSAGTVTADGRRIDITAGVEGYVPATIEAKTGESLVLRFTRTTKASCLAQVVFPDQKITKDLPLNTPVDIPIKAEKPGKIPFQCGMAMIFGSINVTGS